MIIACLLWRIPIHLREHTSLEPFAFFAFRTLHCIFRRAASHLVQHEISKPSLFLFLASFFCWKHTQKGHT